MKRYNKICKKCIKKTVTYLKNPFVKHPYICTTCQKKYTLEEARKL